MNEIKRDVYLVTGPRKSGKTTRVMNLFRPVKSVSGLYAPVIDDKRFVYSIHNRRLILLEADENTLQEDVFKTANYSFRLSAFESARQELSLVSGLGTEWVVIDEVGYFEMRGTGYEPVLSDLIRELKPAQKLVLIVRGEIVEEAAAKYNINFLALPESV